MTDFSPPGSNEETVNSPKLDSPFQSSASSCQSPYSPPSDNLRSPLAKGYHILQKNKSIQDQSKRMNDDDTIWSPHSTTSSIKSPESMAESHLSTDTMSVHSVSTASPLERQDSVFSEKPSPLNPLNKADSISGDSESVWTETQSKTLSSASLTCLICGDKADKEHFSAVVCHSCCGFFKRAIKNNRNYTCIASKQCTLTKKTRNHCQYCRLTRCHKVGMSTTAVEAEVNREKKEKLEKKKAAKESSADGSSSNTSSMIDLSAISNAELFVDPKISNFANVSVDPIRQICLAADKQLASLAEWAKRLPHFVELDILDQVKLLQWNWPELLIGGFCYRSSAVSNGILLSTGLHLSRENLEKVGVGTLVNKLFTEVINKMRKLQIDITEWGCLRAIMLFAPDTKELKNVDQVEEIREKYVATLCHYVKKTYPNDSNRIGKLLLRLPPLKAIALQVLEHLFFFKLIGDVPIDTFLLEMLDVDSH